MQVPPLARSALDRDHAGRIGADAVSRALEQPSTRVIAIAGDRSPVRGGALVRLRADELPPDARHVEPRVPLSWLGRAPALDGTAGGVVLSLLVAEPFDVEGAEWRSLREVGAELDDADAGAFVQAVALGVWQRESHHSPVDGSAASFEESGWVRRDASGGAHFPRTDPAVIVAIRDASDERILLGHNAAWPEGRYSLIAGFVDPGESLEAAVVREVLEETGLAVGDVRYLGSQPWPFPRSLMIGFECVAADPDAIVPDGVEILDVRWFTRDQLRSGVVQLPGPTSIAAWIIDAWLAR
ncbi:NAD(+) diphosphatase [Agrococcus sp. Marseille-Q4369]|uniref:NAD(+) diphosphatase n=1 Tax=Agrococcus sp. Marseille-Q4369 TaxID=2810513 RepID=UPI001B8D2572|nr:NAD(+) diphosphatase [Agrococcus sp. Marseille-Q4369]QUW18820.1 NAD(+) diphosphatase [Agrococcus sp. Marseille-Q4369]